MTELKTLLSKYLSEKDADMLEAILVTCKDISIVIDGIYGPTGKTTLCRELCRMGFHASEAWRRKKNESECNGVSVTITLNQMICFD